MTDLTIADLLEDERLVHFRSTLIQREIDVQSNHISSNTDGSFSMANSNSFWVSILPVAQENKYLGKFSYFIMKF